MVHHLIYTSVARDHFDDNQLLGLLNVARRRNRDLGITGLLLYQDRMFIQLLEGDRQDLDALMRRIGADRRHSAILYLLREPSPFGRIFESWSMGFYHMRFMDNARIPGLNDNRLEAVRERLSGMTGVLAARMLAGIIQANNL